MSGEQSRFTSDRRTPETALWATNADWQDGTTENVDAVEDNLVGRGQMEGEIPSSGPTQSQWETEGQLVQDWWNDYWSYGSTDTSDTRNRSFVSNRFGVQNAIDVQVFEWSDDRAYFSTTAFDLTEYSSLRVYAQGRTDDRAISDQDVQIHVDGNLEFSSPEPGWMEIVLDVSAYAGFSKIELGYRNNRGSTESGTFSEFQLQ